MFDLLYDSSVDVRLVAQNVLLPLFADWSDSLQFFLSSFLTKFLSEIDRIISTSAFKQTSNINSEQDNEKLIILFESLGLIMARFNKMILLSAPFIQEDIIKLQPEQLSPQIYQQLQSKLNSFINNSSTTTTNNTSDWTAFEWTINTFIPKLIHISYELGESNPTLIIAFSSLLNRFTGNFGPVFTEKLFLDQFEKAIGQSGWFDIIYKSFTSFFI